MILMGLFMHVIVRWKCDEQQLKAERQNVAVYVEQERLFQEQLKDDIMERRRLQQVNTGLNAQLQQARLKCGNEVEGGTSEASYISTCIIKELCDNNNLHLTKCRRSDDELFNMIQEILGVCWP